MTTPRPTPLATIKDFKPYSYHQHIDLTHTPTEIPTGSQAGALRLSAYNARDVLEIVIDAPREDLINFARAILENLT